MLTAVAVARSLRWPSDALERIEAGEDPESLPTIAAPLDREGTADQSARALLGALDRLTPGERLRFEAEILEAAAEHVRSQIPPDE